MKIKPSISWFGYLLLFLSLFFNLLQWQTNKNQKDTYLVKDIIDGDTFVTEDHSIVRLFSLNAPELTSCGGGEAKQALIEATINQRVSLDVKTRDEHGRQIAMVYQGKKVINAELLKTGWFIYTAGQTKDRELLKEAITQAKEKKLGIFSSKCTQKENPDNSQCQIKGTIGQSSTNRGNKVYHFPGCSLYDRVIIEKYRDEQWFCTEKEAIKAGFIKASGCRDQKYINEKAEGH